MKHITTATLLLVAITCFALAPRDSASAADHASLARKLATVDIPNPRGIAVDRAGNLYVGDVDSSKIFKISPAGQVSTIGTSDIHDPIALAAAGDGSVIQADADGGVVNRISAAGTVTALGKSGDATISTPTGVALDSAGNVFVANNGGNTILKITPDGTISVFAGKAGSSGADDGTGAAARFNTPRGIAVDGSDNVYVADEGNSNIRKITPKGEVTTLAGKAGQTGTKDGNGPDARFGVPRALAADAGGNVYVADTDNHCIRKITPAGVVTTLAGQPGQAGDTDGVGPAAHFSEPRGIAVDAAGIVYLADSGNASIRQITPAGTVTTIAAAPAAADAAKP